jgi:hypothetical protein
MSKVICTLKACKGALSFYNHYFSMRINVVVFGSISFSSRLVKGIVSNDSVVKMMWKMKSQDDG